MSSAIVLTVFSLLWHNVLCTVFPPVSDPPPIPGQAVRTLDISGQRFYIQDDLQAPQSVIKEDGFYSPSIEPKPDDPWFATENEEFAEEIPTSTETFERLYANGEPAIGPVATPPPDDNYIAQSSGTSKVFPDNSGSGVWVLTKGPNDQYIPERWVPIQVPSTKVIETVNPEVSPKIVTEAIKNPSPLFPIKSKGQPAEQSNIFRQVWVRVPSQISVQKGIPKTVAVEEITSPKHIVDIPYQTSIKQSFQPQIATDIQTIPPPPPVLSKKSSIFQVPPPLPPPQPSLFKTSDLTNSKQFIAVNPPAAPIVDKGNFAVQKSAPVQQVKHIWIPTSQQTGKFITVPVGSLADTGKTISSKGLPVDSLSDVSVSDTWVLKQDGSVPQFEQQKSLLSPQISQKGSIVVEEAPVSFDSPLSSPIIEKSIDAPIPANLWPQRPNLYDSKSLSKINLPQPAIPSPPIKSDSFVIGKSSQIPAPIGQKVYSSKIVQSIPPQQPILSPPPPATLVKGKPPCPIQPQKSVFPLNALPHSLFRSVPAVNRQAVTRVVRVNRYPFGSYYVLNPRVRSNLFSYPRQPTIIKRTNNGLVRLVSTNHLTYPFTQRQIPFPIRAKQVALPLATGKPAPRIIYSSFQAPNQLRYAFPWGSYLNALPTSGKLITPPAKKLRKNVKESSSSSSSSSSESSSESNSKSTSKESKEKEKPAESIGSSESVEPEPEAEINPVSSESTVSEIETEADEVQPAESEAHESIEAAESILSHKVAPRSYFDSSNENSKNFNKPSFYSYDQREIPSITQLRKEIPEVGSRHDGSYDYRDINGILRKVNVLSGPKENKATSYKPGSTSDQNMKVIDSSDALPLENLTEAPLLLNEGFDVQRD